MDCIKKNYKDLRLTFERKNPEKELGCRSATNYIFLLSKDIVSQLCSRHNKKKETEAESVFQRSQAFDALTASFSGELGGNHFVT